jgi:hypothetical protein
MTSSCTLQPVSSTTTCAAKHNSPIEDMRINNRLHYRPRLAARISLELYEHWRRIAFVEEASCQGTLFRNRGGKGRARRRSAFFWMVHPKKQLQGLVHSERLGMSGLWRRAPDSPLDLASTGCWSNVLDWKRSELRCTFCCVSSITDCSSLWAGRLFLRKV